MADWWQDDLDRKNPLTLKRFAAPEWNRPKKKETWVEWDIARFLSQRGCK